ncbi:Glucose-6-phosphate isomerase [Blattamonas nauphoetae]|uniref:Glucose-6-phosphate isomerase n=1 Tax=Blattamonas nauphoetae TaxID=2049346 RepID=A0ABQ9YHS3_9EUKA|nr:Glucose-6-phosphate isomerase [Blattamonas nauphoetae]
MQQLDKHFESVKAIHMKDLFAQDPERAKKFSLELKNGDDLFHFDFSKNRITEETLTLFTNLSKERKVAEGIEAMFSGEIINKTEKRAVLHTALRNRSNRPIIVEGKNVMDDVNGVLDKMKGFTEKVRSGEWKGYTGKPITDVINIGIGGSDLGPLMVAHALTPYANPEKLKVHYISNVDGTHAAEVLKLLNPETCMFIVSSKTFTTQETMTNAHTCRSWWLGKVGTDNAAKLPLHFVAVSTNLTKVAEFGIDTNNTFAFWDWVGGRFSLWSAIGLSTALYVGFDNFIQLLEGGHAMDEHFRTEKDLRKNIPAVLAFIDMWYTSFFKSGSHAVLPYDQYLDRFPAFLQQLEMESNGKGVKMNGEPVDAAHGTSSALFGEPGTNGQHAFYQLIHQGTQLIPCDFIFPLNTHNKLGEHHKLLACNVFAQAEALMKGKTFEQALAEAKKSIPGDDAEAQQKQTTLANHRTFSGNRPSNMIILSQVNPRTVGMLIALYEHKTFVEGLLWEINSFDQWGVELGKELAKDLYPLLGDKEGKETEGTFKTKDSSTQHLVELFRQFNSQ